MESSTDSAQQLSLRLDGPTQLHARISLALQSPVVRSKSIVHIPTALPLFLGDLRVRVRTLKSNLNRPARLELHLRNSLAPLQSPKQGLHGVHGISLELLYLLTMSDCGAPKETDSTLFRLHSYQVQRGVSCGNRFRPSQDLAGCWTAKEACSACLCAQRRGTGAAGLT